MFLRRLAVFFLILFSFSLEAQDKTEVLFKRHYAHLEYRLTFVPQETNLRKSHLHVLKLESEWGFFPKVKILFDLPFIYRNFTDNAGGSTLALANPYAGILWEFLSGIERDFPTFMYFESGVKFPVQGETSVSFKRTDLHLGLKILKEVYYFTLGSHAGYILKWDHGTQKNHGNEFYSFLQGIYHINPSLKLSLDFLFRWAGAYKDNSNSVASQSIFILTPQLLYQLNPLWRVWGSLSFPLRDAQFNNIALAFGDFESKGLLDFTYSIGVSYKF
ncbi:MAG: hypothetical protein HYW47_04500 [Deltaproteobacteria bacterium]|nr:hypothetical protein [Deltaproteobacteria bacterium]